MKTVEHIKPSKHDQEIASASYQVFSTVLGQVKSPEPEIKIEASNKKIRIPRSALKLLGDILKAMSQGKLLSVMPLEADLTTQAAAEMLGCSRPHLVKLLEEGKIEFTKVGKHRRIKIDDIVTYKNQLKEQQRKNIIDIMNADGENEMYDS